MQLSQVDNIEFALLGWSDLDRLTKKLSQAVLASGHHYDRLVPLANGGLTMVRHLADRLGLLTISTMQVALYRGVNERHSQPKVIQPLSVSVKGESILIVEDIVDTGATLEYTLAELKRLGAKEVHTAALIRKSHASVLPEYAALLLDRWVIFPYETRETITYLAARWQKQGLTSAQTAINLQKIGYGAGEIKRYAC